MIAYLKGKISQKLTKSAIILSGDIGYEVFLSLKNLEALNIDEEKEFFIHSYIKEDAFDLYGFVSLEELDFFKKLISVSGVGPKSALNVLALANVEELKRAITSGDYAVLQQVSGIGKKTAERLVVELKEKFITDLSDAVIASDDGKQVIEALVSLGYKQIEAQEIIKHLPEEEADLATKIKQALQFINKK
ncbi:MAG: Holliday junction branch migration protein RuvA [Candidatus Komeilibacteria bacterium]|jgi:holliday junction DNA helicase RuvA|nr:Holliday junction branch migration protein RuvA [Candidatus Komeilibacteria bacterium]MBT4447441.1 Holliday junction branch migration protein RuvA [Candidatus Komeilibacteria bacterium]